MPSDLSQAEPQTDLCRCGHWTRHHTVGKHDGCGHCDCKGFTAYVAPDPEERGFEGHGDFDSDDPYERFIAHQAAKGNL